MARWEIDKVAAAHLLEALKVVLDHLRDFTMTSEAQKVRVEGRSASGTYAQVRRLRTYLQRCVSAYSEALELDLNDEDQNLLAACAVFEVAQLDRRLSGLARPPAGEVAWLEERRRALAHWAVCFATRRIEHIPVDDDSLFLTATVQTVLKEIQRRVVAENQRAGLHRVTRETAGAPDASGGAPMPPPVAPPAPGYVDPYGRPVQYPAAPHGYPDPGYVSPPPAPGYDPYHAAAAYPVPHGIPAPVPPMHHAPPPATPREFGIPAPPGVPGAPAPSRAPAPPAPGSKYPAYQTPRPAQPQAPPPGAWTSPAAPEDDAPVQTGLDLDPRKLHDPRVRGILQLDLRAFERAFRANDHRLCVVHLGSILEASCIDYALAHRRELALNGAPETWNLEVVVRRVLGDEVSSMDRALLFHLNAARNLLRPAIQLSNPLVVTAATQTELTQFVRRVLAAMGYSSAENGAVPQPSGLFPPPASAAPAPSAPARPTPPGMPAWLRNA